MIEKIPLLDGENGARRVQHGPLTGDYSGTLIVQMRMYARLHIPSLFSI
jgi:hypothetical protein